MTMAFVLSGGGSLGAVQVGMMHALADRGERPDPFVGASARALNAAFVAGRGSSADTLSEPETIRPGLGRRDVFPLALRGRAPLAASGALLSSHHDHDPGTGVPADRHGGHAA